MIMFDFLIPFHPKIVHFPIALFTIALFFEILGRIFKKNLLSEAALLVYFCATAFTPMVVLSGLIEEDRLHLHHPVLSAHKNFALLTMWIALASVPILWFLRKKSPEIFRNAFLTLLLVIVVIVTITAHYGGQMVFHYGVGVSM
jgi:uncharacterized membrane protein